MPRESSKSSRSAKTNKTSHVLSLLTSDGESAEDFTSVPEAEEPAPETEKTKVEKTTPEDEKPPDKEPAPEAAKTKTRKPAARSRKKVQTDDQAVAAEIRSALEDALRAEEADKPLEAAGTSAPVHEKVSKPFPQTDTPAPKNEPAPLPPFVPAPASKEEPQPYDLPSFDQEPPEREIPADVFVPEPPKAAQSVRPEPSAPKPVLPPPPPPKAVPKPPVESAASPDDEPFCFNVMEALVESKAEKYIDLFGLCPCTRCRTDVVALALTRLPAKYVVATRADLVPLLSVYEGRYNSAVVSQVMRACNRVADQPRHKKP